MHAAIAHARISIAKQQMSCDLHGEVAILNLKSGIYYGLDRVGLFIWDRLKKSRSFNELLAAVLEQYQVDPDACRKDLTMLIEDLNKAGLIRLQYPAKL